MPPTPPNQRAGELHEAYLADVFSGVKTRASGSQWFDQGDVRNGHDLPFAFCVDGKSTKGKQIAVTLEMIAKIREQSQGERPAIGLRWYATENLDKVAADWVAVQSEDFREILEAARQWAELQRHPTIFLRAGEDMTGEELERFRAQFEAVISDTALRALLPEAAGDGPDLVMRLREEIAVLRDEAATARTEAEAAGSKWSDAMRAAAALREELDRYRAGKVIPPYVPRLPWTVVFQVHLPGHVETSGMHYDAEGAVTQFKVAEIRVERHMGNRPRLIVNNALVADGDLYVDGALQYRAWRDNRDGEAG